MGFGMLGRLGIESESLGMLWSSIGGREKVVVEVVELGEKCFDSMETEGVGYRW